MTVSLAAASGDSSLNLILPAAPELIYGALAFAIVYTVLSRVAFPKLGATLDERSAAIQGKMEEAEKAKSAALASQAEFDRRIADAQAEASRIIEDAKSTSESIRRDQLAKAEAEAASIRERAQADVAGERERLIGELKGQVAEMSVDLAGRIVERELDASKHAVLVDEYINRLATTN